MSEINLSTPNYLSKEQLTAVESNDQQITLHAAAGSGKTRVLVEKYIRQVTLNHTRPDQILTITFTRKAAAEMKRRIINQLIELRLMQEAQIAETGPIQTIHSFCEKVLRENAILAIIDPEFTILSETQTAEIFEKALQKSIVQFQNSSPEVEKLITLLAGKFDYNAPHTLHAKLSSSVKNVLNHLRGSGCLIHELKQHYEDTQTTLQLWQTTFGSGLDQEQPFHLTHPEAALTSGLMQLALAVWSLMEKEMQLLQAFDFTELEAKAVSLIQQSKEVQLRLQKQYKIVLVDEAQDINPVQYQLIKALQLSFEMMVGDPQQSIYGFRLADPKLFMNRLEKTTSLQLSVNYRSSQGILSFIDHLFNNLWAYYRPMLQNSSENPIEKGDFFGSQLPTQHFSVEGVELWEQNRKDHASTAYWIQQLLEEGHQPSDIAVLVRHSAFATELSGYLSALNIPHHIAGGSEKFYTRLEVRDIANALQAIANPYQNFALLSLLHSPIVGLSLDSIVLLAQNKPVIETLSSFQPPLERDKERLEDFLIWFTPLCLHASRLPAWEILSEILSSSGYIERLAQFSGAEQTIANVRKLFYLSTLEPQLLPSEFAEQIRYIQQIRHREGDALAVDEGSHLVTLMTVHKAKGLEFPVVVLPDMHYRLNRPQKEILCQPKSGTVITKFTQEPLKFYKMLDDELRSSEREEELRILYVAMTRAREKLCVCIHPEENMQTLGGLVAKLCDIKNKTLEGVKFRNYKNS